MTNIGVFSLKMTVPPSLCLSLTDQHLNGEAVPSGEMLPFNKRRVFLPHTRAFRGQFDQMLSNGIQWVAGLTNNLWDRGTN